MNKHWIASLLFHQWVLQCGLHLKKKKVGQGKKKKKVCREAGYCALQYNMTICIVSNLNFVKKFRHIHVGVLWLPPFFVSFGLNGTLKLI